MVMPLSENNRRSAIRKRPRGWLKIECRRRGSMMSSLADVVWDVSQTGLCLVSRVELKAGEPLEVEITSSSLTQVIKTTGTVVWIDALDNKQYSVGIRFNETLPYHLVSQLTL